MRAIALASLGFGVVTALAAPAAAKPQPPDDYLVVARDPPPEPEPDPPRRAVVAVASGGMSFASDHDTTLERFGPAAGIGMLYLSHREEPGFEVVGGVTGGERGRSYALSARLVVGSRLERKDGIAPFFAIGFGFAIARLDEDAGKETGAGMGLGPAAALGVHGFISPTVYWRAGAGFVGAGIGTFSTDVSLGWVVGR